MPELSAKLIKAIPPAPDGTRKDYADAIVPGLLLRVTSGGSKSFVLRRRKPGAAQPTRWTLGPWIEQAAGEEDFGSLAWARAQARAKLALLAQGLDPDQVEADREAAARAKREREAAAATLAQDRRTANTVRARGEQFIARYLQGQLGGRYGKETASVFRRDVIGAWGDMQVADVRRSHVRELLAKIETDGGPIAANRRQSAISKFFNWLLAEFDEDETDLGSNPAARLPMRAKEEPRERVIPDPELRLIWVGATATGGAYGAVVKLLAILGQRRGEVGTMRREDLNLAKSEWTIPGSMTKNGRAHLVPLPASAVAIVKAQIAAVDAFVKERDPEAEPGPFVFSYDGGHTAVGGWSKFRGLLDDKIAAAIETAKAKGEKAAKVDDWHLHDLRRTFATGAAGLGIHRDVIGAVLNHTPPGITARHYELYDRAAEKRAALERWAAHLAGIVSGKPAGNVVTLRKGGSRG